MMNLVPVLFEDFTALTGAATSRLALSVGRLRGVN